MKLNRKKIFTIMGTRQKNMTQLQKETGISASSLRYAVHGITNVRPQTAEKIAAALQTDLSELIEE